MRRDLTESDEHRGTAPELPALSDEEWDRLLNAPLFAMATCMKYTKARKSSGRAPRVRAESPSASETDDDGSSDDGSATDASSDAEAPPWAPAEAPPQSQPSASSSARVASGRVLERLSSLGSAEVAAVEEARAGAHFASPQAATAAAPLCPKLRNEVRCTHPALARTTWTLEDIACG